jgi:hypothetical protein
MIPGITSKCSETTVASAASITAKSDIVLVTGTTQINTIIPNFGGGFSGFLVLIPTAGSVILGTSGNINSFPSLRQEHWKMVHQLRSISYA